MCEIFGKCGCLLTVIYLDDLYVNQNSADNNYAYVYNSWEPASG